MEQEFVTQAELAKPIKLTTRSFAIAVRRTCGANTLLHWVSILKFDLIVVVDDL